jgi:UDP-2,3-diacylglucosamine pyrophosphatase LpxH
MRSWFSGFVIAALCLPAVGGAQDTTVVTPITPPDVQLASEAATAGVTKFSFIAYGDTRSALDGISLQSNHYLVVSSILRTIAARATTSDPVKFVVQSGDAVLDGRSARQLSVSYVPVVDRLTTAGMPYYLAVGNHDVLNSTSLTDSSRLVGLRNYFAANKYLIPAEGTPRRMSGYPTYAVAYGNTYVLLFDSIIATDSAQYEWIRKQLEGLDRRRFVNIVVVCHHPAFSSGPHGGVTVDTATLAMRQRYMPLFAKHHVKLMIAGHEHLFEHWVEHYTDATGRHRLDQVVSGGGGAPLYGYTGEPDLRPYLAANAASAVTLEHLVKPGVEPGENPYHYLVVHVDGDQIRIEVIGVDWGQNFHPYRGNWSVLEDLPPAR